MIKKTENKKIIGLATGAYDILHVGHINFLKMAKSKCDILLVGINSDEIIKKYKGEKRPINPQKARKDMLESIKYVDKVFVFNTWEIEPVIAKYKPDVYFITNGDPGEDTKMTVGAKYGAKVVKLKSYNSTPTGSTIDSTIVSKKLQKSCPFYYSYFKKFQKPKFELAKLSTTDIIQKLESLGYTNGN